MTVTKHTLMLMAGGTGGHIFPGLAVATYMRERGWDVMWLGNPNDMEGTLVPQYGFKLYAIQFGGVRGKGILTKISLPFTLLRALFQSYCRLRATRPNVVLGMGGYISFPGAIAAWFLRIPIVIHEQNAVAGLSNRILAKIAQRVLCAFPQTIAGATCVGNPVRSALFRTPLPRQRYASHVGGMRLLIIGGSRGAHALNDVVPKALALLNPDERPEVFHQSGQAQLETLQENYFLAGVNAHTAAFIDDMASAYSEADLVICRAGAMTVAEIAAVGVAALFVPFPAAVDDHQTKNAEYLVSVGAGMLLQQKNLDPQNLAQRLRELTREQLVEMAITAKKQAKPQATADIARVCALLAMPGYQDTYQTGMH